MFVFIELVSVSCGSCGGTKDLVGVLGGSLVVSYSIKDVTQLQLLVIKYGDDAIDVAFMTGDSTLKVSMELEILLNPSLKKYLTPLMMGAMFPPT